MGINVLGWGGVKASGLGGSSLNFYKNLSLTKVLLLPQNFLSLRKLAFHYMPCS